MRGALKVFVLLSLRTGVSAFCTFYEDWRVTCRPSNHNPAPIIKVTAMTTTAFLLDP